ncbi:MULTISPECIES: thiolase family protein [Burkholderia]|jgi:acetyl-CoA acyltransferase|uniref:Thiolase family protein n=2 Tax=Burkholderia contaminans TaxID=488447 RepID=A0A1E3FIS3_9BURK|nr:MULTISPECIES: thiolase family protein [Burkholderia]UTP26314.1 thiolase family protein [Burkholderia sp. FXe9]KKL29564.1 thiolase [Burkholderia contaminans LMG 23361]MBA9835114.1 thiolase family protein [Burkholderia contaminans]MBA9843060.1 thiolase family protein [Burkholderia contaminans]MBA9867671.1 thiolase family protein [Burkholderia contaminans]
MTHMPVWIAGVGMTEFGVRPDVSVKELTQAAVVGALTDAGVHPTAIEAAYFGNTCQDVLEGQVVVAGQMALRSMGFERIPIVNVENACATGATALHQAIMHVRSGAADIVLAVGAEKLSIGDKTKALGVFDGGVDVNDRQGVRAVLEELGGALPDDGKPHSLFMDVYAALARAHMNAFGTTREQLALIASKNHEHAVHNPLAHFRAEMSVEEILAARPVSGPLTVPMCAPLTDGASAVVVCNAAGLKRLDGSRPIRILAAVLQSGTVRPLSAWDRSVTRLAAQAAYEQAGVGPQDISVAEVHDASSFGELLQSELLGFCEIGSGGRFVESGASRLGGRMPINPSGGLESKGHPMGASGLAQIYELVQQLRGNCGARQVAGARIALAENGGGLYAGEEAAAAITILGS